MRSYPLHAEGGIEQEDARSTSYRHHKTHTRVEPRGSKTRETIVTMEYSPSLTWSPSTRPAFFIGIWFALLTRAGGLVIGDDICSCTPSTYEFTFDFALTCPPINVTQGDAIASTACLINPFGDPSVIDLIPVAVQSIDILELNQNFAILVQENIAGSFGDGDSFTYVPIAALPGQITNPVNIPRAIQVNIIGVNRFDEAIINVYLITFSNDCGFFPAFVNGQSAGWTVFTDLGDAKQEYCPAAPPPVDPSSSPTLSTAPSTAFPTIAPSTSPSDNPTDMDSSAKKYVDYRGNNGKPRGHYPLGECQGDCDNDKECKEGLICFHRDGGEAVPGCHGGKDDNSRTDYCIVSPPDIEYLGNNGIPSGAYPLGECQGDCDGKDEECEGNLICFHRDGGEPVPGCLGGEYDNSRTDYCVSP